MAIAAQLEDVDGTAGKPREPRRKLRLEASGALASGTATDVLIHNVSATGLLLESAVSLATGERIEIDLPHAGSAGARVVWTSGNLFGCQFDAPISAAALSAAQLRGTAGEAVEIAAPGTSSGDEASAGEAFGVRLQRLRKQQRMTLSQLAGQLGVSKPTVWAWEQGKARPVAGRIEALAQALGVASAELQPGRDDSRLRDLLARSREQIARAVGTSADKVRIMIEL